MMSHALSVTPRRLVAALVLAAFLAFVLFIWVVPALGVSIPPGAVSVVTYIPSTETVKKTCTGGATGQCQVEAVAAELSESQAQDLCGYSSCI